MYVWQILVMIVINYVLSGILSGGLAPQLGYTEWRKIFKYFIAIFVVEGILAAFIWSGLYTKTMDILYKLLTMKVW
jgi:uncharacterized membrane protein